MRLWRSCVVGRWPRLPWLSLKYVPLAAALAAVVCWTAGVTGRPGAAGGRRWWRPAASPSPWSCTSGSTAAGPRSHATGGHFAATDGTRRPASAEPRLPGTDPPPRRAAGRRHASASPPGAPAWLFLPLAAGAAARSLRRPIGRAPPTGRWRSWPLRWPSGGWWRRSRRRRCTAGGRRAASSWSLLPAGVLLWPGCSRTRPDAAAAVLRRRRARRRHLVLDHGRGGDPSPHAGGRLRGRASNPWYRLWRRPCRTGAPAPSPTSCCWRRGLPSLAAPAPLRGSRCRTDAADAAAAMADLCHLRLRKVRLQSVSFQRFGYGEVGR